MGRFYIGHPRLHLDQGTAAEREVLRWEHDRPIVRFAHVLREVVVVLVRLKHGWLHLGPLAVVRVVRVGTVS